MADTTACAPSAPRVNKTIRISNIPISISRALLQKYLQELDKPLGTIAVNNAGDLHISLAPEASEEGHLRFQVATVTFSCLINIHVPSVINLGPPGVAFEGTVDTHFRGLTPLNNPKDPTIDIIAVTGLAGHAFGSWSSREKNEMWLRDFLPSDMEDNGHRPRILTYGYDTALKGSHSDAGIYHFSKQFIAAVKGARSRDPTRPLILIGHSLGGLVIKEAIIETSGGGQESVLRCCIGMLFFSVPHKGLADARLVCMVHGQPNENLVRDLCRNSQFLRTLDRSFGHRVGPGGLVGSNIVSFYETKDTITVKEVRPGVWARAGPYVRMVTEESVRHAAENGQYLPLDADHSSIVKFTSRSDENYQIARRKLLDIARVGMMAPRNLEVPCEERIKICKWLYPSFDEKHIEISGKRQENTGGWLLADNRFTSWRDGSGPRLLWGCGIPGAGKTFLSSLVIDVLDARSRGYSNTGLAYIYFNYKDENQQMPVALLRSLIKQLVTKPRALSFPIPKPVRSLYDNNCAAGSTPRLKDLQDALAASLALFMETFFVFDALDECRETIRKDLLPLIHWIAGSGGRVFLTSRPYPHDIAISLTPTTDTNVDVQRLDLEAKEEDVKVYIEETIQGHTTAQKLITGDLRARVVSRLVDVCKGMFLLVHFYIEDLCQYPTTREIRRELDGVSSVLGAEKALDGTYSRVIDSIRAQHTSRSRLALKALTWLLTADHTLTVDELRMAVAMGDGSRQGDPDPFDEAEMPHPSSLVDVCRGLVMIDHNSNTIKLVHYSVHEYLERTCALGRPADRHFTVAFGCLDHVWVNHIEPKPRRDCMPRFTGLIKYARIHLHTHMQACHHIAPMETLLRFLRNADLVRHLGKLETRMLLDDFGAPEHSDESAYGPLHEATAWGSTMLVNSLLNDGADTHADAGSYMPLHVAAGENLVDMVRFWLEKGVDVDAGGGGRGTPLSCAIRRGSIDTARVLLGSGADVMSALRAPGWGGEEVRDPNILGLLFEFGLSVEHRLGGETYLHRAAKLLNSAPVEVLLRKGARIHVRSKQGRTPLHEAVYQGNINIARLLLQHGYGGQEEEEEEEEERWGGRLVDARDCEGQTPLHHAAKNMDPDMLQLLLSHGRDGTSGGQVRAPRVHEHAAAINMRDSSGCTPLSHAYRYNNKDRAIMAKMLVDAGADLTVTPYKGYPETWLHMAAASGNMALLNAALDAGVALDGEGDEKGGGDESPLHLAAASASAGVVSLLVEKGFTVDLRDQQGRTPLHLARGATIPLLLDQGARICWTDNEGNLPLHCRLEHEYFRAPDSGEMVMEDMWILVEAGADVNARNKRGVTPLHLAAAVGLAGPVSLLLERGADMRARDANQMSAMHHAAGSKGGPGAISVLMEWGMSMEERDINGRTALHHACIRDFSGPRPGNAAFLVGKGCSVDLQDSRGDTPLKLLIGGPSQDAGDVATIKQLIEAGAGVNNVYDGGVTLLLMAARQNSERVLTLLLDAGAQVNARDGCGRTPLHHTASAAIVKLLVERGADASDRDAGGNTPLRCLLGGNQYWSWDAAKALISAGANVNEAGNDKDESPLLHLAASQDMRNHFLPLFLDAGADVHARDSHKRTVLHHAVLGHADTYYLEFIAREGADVNARDIDGNTPLHYLLDNSRYYWDRYLVLAGKRLISLGADVNAVADDRIGPLHLVAQMGSKEALALLLDAGADVHARDRAQRTPLHHAVLSNGSSKSVRSLADDCDNAKKAEGTEHPGTREDHREILALLLKAGADVGACDGHQETPLDIAIKRGFGTNLTELLVDRRGNKRRNIR